MPHGNLFSDPDLPPAECMVVIDCGLIFTHVVPIISGEVVWSAVKR